jgi:hypothetical protein
MLLSQCQFSGELGDERTLVQMQQQNLDQIKSSVFQQMFPVKLSGPEGSDGFACGQSCGGHGKGIELE